MSGKPAYRPLLPAASTSTDRENSASDPNSTSQSSYTSDLRPAKRRAAGASTACSECRARKKKCDGIRPACSNCAARKIDSCYYNDPAEDPASEILKLLRSLSLDRARAALTVLRSHKDSGAALSFIRQNTSPDTDPFSSGHSGSRRLSLATELSDTYPSAYIKLSPVSTKAIRQSRLTESGRTAPVSHPSPPDAIQSRDQQQNHNHNQNHNQKKEKDRGQLELGAKYALDDDSAIQRYRQPSSTSGRSVDAIDLCDQRLKRLDMSFWTTVQVSDEFAARAISLYLQTDHPLLGLFDPHLFVADLVEHRTHYCSSFLVNALMYLSCQMYTALDKRASEHVTPFWNEANRLQIQDADCDSMCTMSALVLMSLSLTGHGKDHDVIRFSKHANIISQKLGFFDPNSVLASKHESEMSEEDRACCHAAWSSFNWSMIIAMFHRQPEVVVVRRPPALPILDCWTSTAVDRQQTTATGADGMSSHETASQPILVGAAFTALCQFCEVMHGALWVYYPGEMTAPPENLKWKLAEHKFCEILAWTKHLPDIVTREGPHPSQVDVLHMWLHAALMDLMRPFIGQDRSTDERLTTFAAENNSVLSAYKASTDQLKRLILDYRTNHEASAYSILWHTGLLYLVNAMLENPRDPDWHIYFLLCIHGYENLRRPYLISEAIGRSLLALTLRRTDMSADEARRIMAEIEQGGLERVEAEIRAPFMGDLQMALNDPENASVEMTARLFEEMALFNEVLDQSVMDIP